MTEVMTEPCGVPTLNEVTRGIFRRAKEAVLEHGWHGGVGHGYQSADGSVCVIGAITLGMGGDPRFSLKDVAAADLLAPLLGFADSVDAIGWNDRGGRTQTEIIDRFDRALTA